MNDKLCGLIVIAMTAVSMWVSRQNSDPVIAPGPISHGPDRPCPPFCESKEYYDALAARNRVLAAMETAPVKK